MMTYYSNDLAFFQIGLELHTGNTSVRKENLAQTLIGLMKNLRDLHKLGSYHSIKLECFPKTIKNVLN
jgi:hypothetical protein